MSYLPVMESESSILIEACLAGMRRNAGLDDEPVLPSIASVLPPPPPMAAAEHHPCTTAPAWDAEISGIVEVGAPRPVMRKIARRLRWPIFLCAFVGGTSGGIALMKSPAASTPVAQNAARHAAGAWRAVTGE